MHTGVEAGPSDSHAVDAVENGAAAIGDRRRPEAARRGRCQGTRDGGREAEGEGAYLSGRARRVASGGRSAIALRIAPPEEDGVRERSGRDGGVAEWADCGLVSYL
jgi:hypothetical protein